MRGSSDASAEFVRRGSFDPRRAFATKRRSVITRFRRWIVLFILRLLRHSRSRDRVFFVDPATQVDQLAPRTAEGKGWEIVECFDLIRFGTGRTPALNHGSLFEVELVEVEAGLAGSLLGELVVVSVFVLSVVDLAGSLEGLSASAAFL